MDQTRLYLGHILVVIKVRGADLSPHITTGKRTVDHCRLYQGDCEAVPNFESQFSNTNKHTHTCRLKVVCKRCILMKALA